MVKRIEVISQNFQNNIQNIKIPRLGLKDINGFFSSENLTLDKTTTNNLAASLAIASKNDKKLKKWVARLNNLITLALIRDKKLRDAFSNQENEQQKILLEEEKAKLILYINNKHSKEVIEPQRQKIASLEKKITYD